MQSNTEYHPIKALIMRLIELAQRYPWAIALFGFFSGTASYFMVERSTQLAQFLTVFLLVIGCSKKACASGFLIASD